MSVNIFWDNSNIMWVGRNLSRKLEPGYDRRFRICFSNLFQFAKNGREVSYAFVAGSIPPRSDDLWKRFKELGVDVETQERGSVNGKEIAVDDIIHKKMLERIIDVNPPETMVLLTGDGNGYSQGEGFIAQLGRAVKCGWGIEVISWSIGCNRHLKEFALANGVYRELDPVYESVTFISGGRRFDPLP